MAVDSRVLVVGVRHGSLGEAVSSQLEAAGSRVLRAGIATEACHLPLNDWDRAWEVFSAFEPTHIVCTAGVNEPLPIYDHDWPQYAEDHMKVNYLGPMMMLSCFEYWLGGMPGVFVAISSNSAHIARSNSAAYCASKAALSMGLRCAARDLSRAGKPLRVWGYEPGLLAGTPMTRDVRLRLGKEAPLSRMLTAPEGLSVGTVAATVVRDVLAGGNVLHGCVVRLDNGEQ